MLVANTAYETLVGDIADTLDCDCDNLKLKNEFQNSLTCRAMQENEAEPTYKKDLKSNLCLKSSLTTNKSIDIDNLEVPKNKLQSELFPKTTTGEVALNDTINSQEPKKNLLLEARHTLSIAVAKQRRASVSSSLFLPKELARKRSEIMVARHKYRLGQKFRSTIRQKEQHMRQRRRSYNIEHPRSFPIQRTAAIDKKQLRTAIEALRISKEQHNNNNNEEFMQESVSVSNTSLASNTTMTIQETLFAGIVSNEVTDLESLRLDILNDINSNSTQTQSDKNSNKGIAENYSINLDMFVDYNMCDNIKQELISSDDENPKESVQINESYPNNLDMFVNCYKFDNIKQELLSSDNENLIESVENKNNQRPSVIMTTALETEQLETAKNTKIIEDLTNSEFNNMVTTTTTIQPKSSLNERNSNRIRRSLSVDNITSDVNIARILCEQNLCQLRNVVTKTLNAFRQNPLLSLVPQQQTCSDTSHEISGNWNDENLEPITSTQSLSNQRTEAQQQEITDNFSAVNANDANEKENDLSVLIPEAFDYSTNQKRILTLESNKEIMTVDNVAQLNTQQDSLTVMSNCEPLKSNILKRHISEMPQVSQYRKYESFELLKQQQLTNIPNTKWNLEIPEALSSTHSLSIQALKAKEQKPILATENINDVGMLPALSTNRSETDQPTIMSETFAWPTNQTQHLNLQSIEESQPAAIISEFNAEQAFPTNSTPLRRRRNSEMPQRSYYTNYENFETQKHTIPQQTIRKWSLKNTEPTSSTRTHSNQPEVFATTENINDVDMASLTSSNENKKVKPLYFPWSTNQTQPLSLQSTEESASAAVIQQLNAHQASLKNSAPLQSDIVRRRMSEMPQTSYYQNQTAKPAEEQPNIPIINWKISDINQNSSTQTIPIQAMCAQPKQFQQPKLILKSQQQQQPQLLQKPQQQQQPQLLQKPQQQHQQRQLAVNYTNNEIFPWSKTQAQAQTLNVQSKQQSNTSAAWPTIQSQPLNLQNKAKCLKVASRDSQMRAQDFTNCSSLHNLVQCRKVSKSTSYNKAPKAKHKLLSSTQRNETAFKKHKQVAKNVRSNITNSNTHNPADYSIPSYAPEAYNSVFQKWLTSTSTATTTTHTTTEATNHSYNHNVYQQKLLVEQHFLQSNFTVPTTKTNRMSMSQLTYPKSFYVEPQHSDLICYYPSATQTSYSSQYQFQHPVQHLGTEGHQLTQSNTVLNSPYIHHPSNQNTMPTQTFPNATTMQFPISPPPTPTHTHLQQQHKIQLPNRAMVMQNQDFNISPNPLGRPETHRQLQQSSTPANNWLLETTNEHQHHNNINPYFQHLMKQNQNPQMYYPQIVPDRNRCNLSSCSDNLTMGTPQPQQLPQQPHFDFQSSSFANYETSLLNKYNYQHF